MKRSEAIEILINSIHENMDIDDMTAHVEESLREGFSVANKAQLEEAIQIHYDEDVTIEDNWLELRVIINADGVYIYNGDEEVVSWLWEEFEEDEEVGLSIFNAICLSQTNPQKLLNTLNKNYIDIIWPQLRSNIEQDIRDEDWTAIYELLSFLPDERLKGFLR